MAETGLLAENQAGAKLDMQNCGQEGQHSHKTDDGKRDQFLFVDFQSYLLAIYI